MMLRKFVFFFKLLLVYFYCYIVKIKIRVVNEQIFLKIFQGALAGGISSTLLVGWISLGTQAAIMRGEIIIFSKAVSVDGCEGNYTVPKEPSMSTETEFDRLLALLC